MTRRPSRRTFLESTAGSVTVATLGSVALAGCTFLESDDPPPVDATASELASIAEIDRPTRLDDLPLEVGDDRVDDGIGRAESLLEPIPDDLADEIPNEAVRQSVAENRDEARSRLADLDAEPTTYARLSALRGIRRRAGEAEAVYAAATGDRTPDDLEGELTTLEAELESADAALARSGTDEAPYHAVVVYGVVERRLDAAERFVEEARRPMPGTSTVEAVGRLANRREWAAASLDEARYLADRQADVGDRPLDDAFETAASTLLGDLDDRIGGLPLESSDPVADLFDASVDGTALERTAELAIGRVRSNRDSAVDYRDGGRLARALRSLHTAETSRRTIERLRSAVDDGEVDRPEDAADVRDAKQTAVAAIESVRDETPYPYLVDRSLGMAISNVRGADQQLERDADRRADSVAVWASAEYAHATAWARSVPGATEWLVDDLP